MRFGIWVLHFFSVREGWRPFHWLRSRPQPRADQVPWFLGLQRPEFQQTDSPSASSALPIKGPMLPFPAATFACAARAQLRSATNALCAWDMQILLACFTRRIGGVVRRTVNNTMRKISDVWHLQHCLHGFLATDNFEIALFLTKRPCYDNACLAFLQLRTFCVGLLDVQVVCH